MFIFHKKIIPACHSKKLNITPIYYTFSIFNNQIRFSSLKHYTSNKPSSNQSLK